VSDNALDREQQTDEDIGDDQMSDADAAEVTEIRAEIEETRLEMGGTLNELGDKLEPSHLVNQAKENVREATIGRVEETAKDVSTMVMETIKRNPIPAAIAGAGLAMLWANRSKTNEVRYSYGDAYGDHRGSYGNGKNQGVGSKVGDAASTVGDNVAGAVGSVAEGAGQVTGEAIDRGRETVGQVGSQLDRFMRANPLAMGAVAIGAGAVIGSVLPETPKEKEMLGEASRQLGSAVRDTVDDVSSKAHETLDKAEEKVGATAY